MRLFFNFWFGCVFKSSTVFILRKVSSVLCRSFFNSILNITLVKAIFVRPGRKFWTFFLPLPFDIFGVNSKLFFWRYLSPWSFLLSGWYRIHFYIVELFFNFWVRISWFLRNIIFSNFVSVLLIYFISTSLMRLSLTFCLVNDWSWINNISIATSPNTGSIWLFCWSDFILSLL